MRRRDGDEEMRQRGGNPRLGHHPDDPVDPHHFRPVFTGHQRVDDASGIGTRSGVQGIGLLDSIFRQHRRHDYQLTGRLALLRIRQHSAQYSRTARGNGLAQKYDKYIAMPLFLHKNEALSAADIVEY